MNLLSYDYLYQQTVAGPDCNNHWIDLITGVLAKTRSGQAHLIDGQWMYPASVAKKVLAMTPAQLSMIMGEGQQK